MWSLGVLIFTMLNKSVPFDNSNVTILYDHQIKRKYKFRERVCGNVTMEIKKLIKNMLEPISKKRPFIDEVLESPWYRMDPRLHSRSSVLPSLSCRNWFDLTMWFSELSEFEAAALEEAKKSDLNNMKSTVIESGLTDILSKHSKTTGGIINWNLFTFPRM